MKPLASPPKPVREWLDAHPWVAIYTAIVVTILLAIQFLEYL